MTISHSLRKGLDAGTPSLLPQELSRCSSPEARKLLNFEVAKDLCVLPLGFLEQYGNTVLTIAVGNPSSEVESQLRFLTGHHLRVIRIDPKVIREAVFQAYRGAPEHLEDAVSKVSSIASRKVAGPIPGLREIKTAENDLLCSLIDYSLALNATDLHFIPREEGLFVSVRAEGELRTRDTKLCSSDVYDKMVQRLKILSRLDITQKHHVQEGSFTVPLSHGTVTARVSIIPTVYGESISIRFLNQSRFISLEDLHFSDEATNAIAAVKDLRNGLVIFSGSTGSGKTTSLYALTEYLSRFSKRIASIEDPVECIVPWMMQTQVNKERGPSFEEGLKALLRQDPDVIMVGEIRDAAVATVALEAALTGHLVLCSLHAGSTQEAIVRMNSLVKEKGIPLSTVVRLVVYQELLLTPQGPTRAAYFEKIGV